MSDAKPKCELCGHPMPDGEEMFKIHGYSCECPGPPVHTPELPELTDEERAALESCDMTEILGTWEERFHVAARAAMRWLRERNQLRQELDQAVAAQERLKKRCEQLRDDVAHAVSANERLDAMLDASKKRFFTANQLAIKRTLERDAALRNARDYKQMAEEERAECFRLIDQYGEHQDGCTSKDGDVDCECGFHAAYLRASTRLAACQSLS
jgi:hypothetical protein